ncbi:MAG TPA: hypothetical protein VE954_29155 [Oligoflexus sp.]|uniref:hypothetical protein n=1 Tax=Oligoflexus sp. TaxID=1971216 RepID=UPI002D46F855|nr:hypothetical protein [Oligoflexus sp.]HYX37191.1 hypothetical protein [Oligoflexus sp.]
MTLSESNQEDILASQSPSSLYKRVSWASVLAGVVVVLVVQLALSLLGIGIGASTVDPLTEKNPVAGMGVGSGIWLAISTLIALFAGGWVAGRLSGMERKVDGSLHGILTWGLATLLTFYFMTSAVGGLVSGAASMVSRAANLVGQGVSSSGSQIADVVEGQLAARGIDMSDIQREAKEILRQTGKAELQPEQMARDSREVANQAQTGTENTLRNPDNSSEELSALVNRVFTQGKQTLDAADKEALTNVIVARTDMTKEEASTTVDRWHQTFLSAQANFEKAKVAAEQQARETGDAAAKGLSKASLWGFVALVLGAIAAAIGGFIGVMSDINFLTRNKKSGTNFRQTVLHS